LILLGGCGWILGLHQRLLDDSGRLSRRDGPAAFEGPRAGAAGREQREREPDGEEGGETFDGDRVPLAGTEPRTSNFEPRTSTFVVLRGRERIQTFDGGGEPNR
jgi:hypothetical protein